MSSEHENIGEQPADDASDEVYQTTDGVKLDGPLREVFGINVEGRVLVGSADWAILKNSRTAVGEVLRRLEKAKADGLTGKDLVRASVVRATYVPKDK